MRRVAAAVADSDGRTWRWTWKREGGEGGTALSVPNTITHLLHSPHLIDNANLINICNL